MPNIVHFLSFFALFLIILSIANADEQKTKNPFLKKFSTLSYDVKALNDHHHRAKRSTTNNHVKFSFEGSGKVFKLDLVPKNADKILNTKHAELSNGKISLSDFTIYEGVLEDEPDTSKVSGTIIEGVFVGTIECKSGKYYIESSKRYGNDDLSEARAVIYHEDDINSDDDIIRAKRDLSKSFKQVNDQVSDDDLNGNVGCGATHKRTRDLLKQEQHKATIENLKKKKRDIKIEDLNAELEKINKYSREANENIQKLHREKRQTAAQINFPNDKSVNSLNSIYGSTKFFVDSTRYYTGISFKITRIKIFNFNDCSSSNSTLSSTEKNLCQNYLDPVTFLNFISQENYTDYCTAFTFTSRDYADGTLGLAWLATASSAVGGFCEKPTTVNGALKSLNSGMVTVVNFNARVPDRVQQITFAHEIGHNFGSTHDLTTDSTCAPGGSNGNFIMYSRATSGKLPNNDDFSSCSQRLIGSVLDYVVQGSKNCFKTVAETSGAICGNGIAEESEECDYSVFNDKCCTTDCKLAINPATNAKYTCSPSKGSCCSDQCEYRTSLEICLPSSGCIKNVNCTGSSSVCPAQDPNNYLPDNSLCNDATQTCKNGTCTGSLCSYYSNLNECSLTGDLSDKNTDRRRLCLTSCTGSITNNVCTVTSSITGLSGREVTLRAGTPCAGTQGYCDMFGICRSVNADSSFQRLLSTLLAPNSITINDVKTWVQTYWWAILIFCLILIAFNVAIIVCITRHMKSDNPEKKKPLKIKHSMKSPGQVFSSGEKKVKTRPTKSRRDNMRPTVKELAPGISEYRQQQDSSRDTSRSNRSSSARASSRSTERRRGSMSRINEQQESYEL